MTLNPVLRIDTQMIEAVTAHQAIGRDEARARCIDALARVGIARPRRARAVSAPVLGRHAPARGHRHRAAEPARRSSSPTNRRRRSTSPSRARSSTRSSDWSVMPAPALIWITHDLAVVAGLADRIAVMYAGRIVETGPVAAVLDSPRHPYTRGLLGSVPANNPRGHRLRQIPGMMPSPLALPAGCAFRPRCDRGQPDCEVPLAETVAADRSWRCRHPLADDGS